MQARVVWDNIPGVKLCTKRKIFLYNANNCYFDMSINSSQIGELLEQEFCFAVDVIIENGLTARGS